MHENAPLYSVKLVKNIFKDAKLMEFPSAFTGINLIENGTSSKEMPMRIENCIQRSLKRNKICYK